MAGRMWLANANYGAWVPCPSIEMPSGTQKWGASGQFLNGGAYVRRSITGARVFEMNWPMKHQGDLDTVEAFFEGAYGEGPFFVTEPGSMVYNMFPAYLATPGMGVSDGPTLLYDKRPSVAQYESPSGEPIRGAAYSKTVGDMINKFTIAVPEGYTLHTHIRATEGSMLASNMDGSPATEGTPGAPGTDYAWTGTPGASTSTKSVDGAVVAENYLTNPSFEYGVTGWSAGTNLAITQNPGVVDGTEGNYSAALTPDGGGTPGNALAFSPRTDVTAGETISVRGRVSGNSGSVPAVVRMLVHAYDSGGFHSTLAEVAVSTLSGSPASMNEALLEGLVVPAEVVTVQIAWSLPAGYDASGWTSGGIEIDAHTITSGNSVDAYFDGDTPDIPEVPAGPGGLAHGIRQWAGGRLLQFHLNPDYIGTAVVYSMCAVAVPDSEPFDIEAHVNSGRFPRGKGSAGMEVDGDFERTSYSAALDRYHGSVRLVEVEPWL